MYSTDICNYSWPFIYPSTPESHFIRRGEIIPTLTNKSTQNGTRPIPKKQSMSDSEQHYIHSQNSQCVSVLVLVMSHYE